MLFAGVAVADYDAALPWYVRLLGRPPDMIPQQDEAAWRLADTGWIYLVAGLTERGLAAGPIELVGVLCEKW